MTPWGENNHIVLIDDSIDFSKMVRKALIRSGYQGEIKGYPFANAFYEVCEVYPDLVICDQHMPGDKGLDVHDKLRAEGYEGGFILVSADTQSLDDSWARLRDIEYLLKPFSVPEFIEKCQQITVNSK